MSNKTIVKSIKVSPEEMKKICTKADALNITTSKYIRTMALDGKILRLEVPEYYQTIKELHRIGALLNQITRRLNETGSLYYDEMQNIKDEHENLCRMLNQYISSLKLAEQ